MRLHMNIVYVHGLDSDANSTKGLLLEGYYEKNYPEIKVHRPDLNQTPEQVFNYLTNLVTKLSSDSKVVLVGSSLGGYFSTLVSNQTGCAALLINPSTQPHITLQRFEDDKGVDTLKHDDHEKDDRNKQILHTTEGGWAITKSDLQWFAEHQLSTVNYPNKIAVLIKEGDELLDANLSAAFYQEQGATITMQSGGDHRFSDFGEQLPKVFELIQQLS